MDGVAGCPYISPYTPINRCVNTLQSLIPDGARQKGTRFDRLCRIPDVIFLHDVTERNKLVRLGGGGSIVYGMRFTATLACMMDLHYYPLDSQNCTVEIESCVTCI
ncbi:Gamma-aminobutyric acid receptor subunit beta-like [Eumeta japonica]|uniref:Gamma-aminobutyric acid receptor subunit beta-like n=1 Tax=Eumeta variegata TaxID=151549 RepID=A0A4C1TSM6_EUMVA|nr:Gamma-aminobutyric acid receptor subunit beta-like [Eumeta japonica]